MDVDLELLIIIYQGFFGNKTREHLEAGLLLKRSLLPECQEVLPDSVRVLGEKPQPCLGRVVDTCTGTYIFSHDFGLCNMPWYFNFVLL